MLGNVVKGPLSHAFVFLDYDNNGVQNSNEPFVRTAADDSFSISTNRINYTIVALTDDSTIDTSSGSVLSGITLKAPATASASTTLMQQGSLTAEQVSQSVGLASGC